MSKDDNHPEQPHAPLDGLGAGILAADDTGMVRNEANIAAAEFLEPGEEIPDGGAKPLKPS